MSRLKSILTGADQRDGYAFAKPFDIAVHRGRLFISDTVHRVVFALDFVSGESIIIGDSGDASDLFKPLGVATDNQGNLYVCDIHLKKVMLYDRNGKWRYDIDLSNEMDRPSGVEVSGDGSTIFVVDIGGVKSKRHRVAVYDTNSRSHLRTLGSRGTKSGEFNLPRDVAVGHNNHLYVTDGGNFRVQVIDQQGENIRSWGTPGRHLGQFSRPKGIASDSAGNIYVVDAAFGNFQIFTPNGELLLYLGTRSETAGPAKYMLPAGIDVDEDGRIYLVDQFYRKVEVFRPAGLAEDEGYSGLAQYQ
ncbi:MAG: 6-bladed beta-propeller [Candidatus Thiodiazotropha lotti]|nr:6-bladed beta-propeller [Candidatus Thiodiazotropha lotti]MCW4221354.1 6-bladed beta-propeller [Candidatus Thiodiazotropha lotti]